MGTLSLGMRTWVQSEDVESAKTGVQTWTPKASKGKEGPSWRAYPTYPFWHFNPLSASIHLHVWHNGTTAGTPAVREMPSRFKMTGSSARSGNPSKPLRVHQPLVREEFSGSRRTPLVNSLSTKWIIRCKVCLTNTVRRSNTPTSSPDYERPQDANRSLYLKVPAKGMVLPVTYCKKGS